MMRELSEPEVRGAFVVLMQAVQYARRTTASWNVRRRKPTVDEMMMLCMQLKSVEDKIARVAKGVPTDAPFDGLIAHFADLLDELNQEASITIATKAQVDEQPRELAPAE